MATNSQILERFLDGETLLPSEKQQLVRAAADWDAARYALDGVMNGRQGLEHPMIFDPNWRTSPLHLFTCTMTTDEPITINTWETLTFDSGSGDLSIFDFWKNNKSKIRIDRNQYGMTIDGFIGWADNTTGDRIVRIRLYDKDDNLLANGTQELSKVPTTNSAAFGMIQNFFITDDIRAFFPNAAYFQLEVFQNGVDGLVVQNAYMTVRVA